MFTWQKMVTGILQVHRFPHKIHRLNKPKQTGYKATCISWSFPSAALHCPTYEQMSDQEIFSGQSTS